MSIPGGGSDADGGGDAKIMVLTRKKDDANTETIRENMVCFKSLQITAEAIALVRGSEVLDSLDKRPNTVGIVNVGTSLRERQNVKAISIDGIGPSPVVASAEGQKILARRGVIAAK